MPTDSESDFHLEIGHVLFIDIVGYSKLLINEQSERIQELREIVRRTEQFRLAEAEGKLMRLPTGDGGALVFRTSPEAPVLCALEISKALKTHPELRLRMGIHSGPVNEVADLNEQVNMAGAGVNIAQRVMDCGDAEHILLSKHAAEDLAEYRQWQLQLHDLGECDVKHGGQLHVVNLYTGEVGNPQVPTKFRQAVTKRRRALIAVLILFAAAAGGGYYFFSQRLAFKAPDKSIAVLPFENLSQDKANAYFAEGMQDEILARLSKIADLKVISRTSTLKYKSTPDNLREIAKQLGVANILEGSVQKSW
jgi:adenylate cyclase